MISVEKDSESERNLVVSIKNQSFPSMIKFVS